MTPRDGFLTREQYRWVRAQHAPKVVSYGGIYCACGRYFSDKFGHADHRAAQINEARKRQAAKARVSGS
jgi:hypothetical protein